MATWKEARQKAEESFPRLPLVRPTGFANVDGVVLITIPGGVVVVYGRDIDKLNLVTPRN